MPLDNAENMGYTIVVKAVTKRVVWVNFPKRGKNGVNSRKFSG